MNNKWIRLFVSIAIPFIAGGIGSFFTYKAINNWYQVLNKPSFSPPNSLFGPVWTILYILMGISFFLIWESKAAKYKKSNAYKIYFAQVVLNSLWSIFFFGLHNPLLAFLEIITLWISIFFTIRSFYMVNKKAALLLYPYLAWVSFASVLNLSIVLLNK